MSSVQKQNSARRIAWRTRGHTQGAITRLVSPSDLGELIKPFVFLDLAQFDGRYAPTPMGFGWHPHSGIATVTVMVEGNIRFAETTGQRACCRPLASSGCGRATASCGSSSAGTARCAAPSSRHR